MLDVGEILGVYFASDCCVIWGTLFLPLGMRLFITEINQGG